MQMHDIAMIVTAITLIGLTVNLLYTMKAYKALILCSILLIATEITVILMHYESKWYVLSILPLYFFALIYMMAKLRIRINETLKRINEIEKEKVKSKCMEE